jgi:hypothetical protein
MKKEHFRKSKKKKEILACGEILFLFIGETYKTNKLWHMRPLSVLLYLRYLNLRQKVPKQTVPKNYQFYLNKE